MTHEGIPRVLYDHPIVEYIPLVVATALTGPLPPAVRLQVEAGSPEARAGSAFPAPSLHALASEESWRAAIGLYPFAFPPLASLPPIDTPLFARPELHLLALGFRVTGGIYRGRKVSLAATAVGPVFHLFAVPLKYFYKSLIDFYAYTGSGARLAETTKVRVLSPGTRRVPPSR